MEAADKGRPINAARHHAAHLRTLADELLRMADEIDKGLDPSTAVETLPSASRATAPGSASKNLWQVAMDTYRMRRKRNEFLPETFFGEPAWDVLLDLYANDAVGKPVPVSSACIAASVPQSTGLRWIRVLENNGFIKRVQNPADSRVTLVCLTELARVKISGYLRLLANADEK